jgi:hypothetical protein
MNDDEVKALNDDGLNAKERSKLADWTLGCAGKAARAVQAPVPLTDDDLDAMEARAENGG